MLRSLPQLDVESSVFARDPYSVLRELLARSPLAESVRGVEVLSYAAVSALLPDERLTPGHGHAAPAGPTERIAAFRTDGLLLEMKGERHRRVRRVFGRAFALKRIDQRLDVMRRAANRLVDGFVDRGECDFVGDFTHRYSIFVICSLLGVDSEDIQHFDRATTELRLMANLSMEGSIARIDAALDTLWTYTSELVARRVAAPRDDFISVIIEAQRTEGNLTEAELVWGIANLLFAGHDTTRNQLALCLEALTERADGWRRLQDGADDLVAVIHESLRYRPVVQSLSRFVEEDIEVEGVHIPAGTNVVLNMMAASRDPSRFERPDQFDPSRPLDAYGIAFGGWLHHCLGHALAKAEMTEALQVLRTRLSDVRVSGKLERHPYSSKLGGVHALPIRFEPSSTKAAAL